VDQWHICQFSFVSRSAEDAWEFAITGPLRQNSYLLYFWVESWEGRYLVSVARHRSSLFLQTHTSGRLPMNQTKAVRSVVHYGCPLSLIHLLFFKLAQILSPWPAWSSRRKTDRLCFHMLKTGRGCNYDQHKDCVISNEIGL